MLGFLIEMIVFLSAVLLGRFQSKSGVRNITAIVSAFGISGVLVLGQIVESIGISQSVALNALLIMLRIASGWVNMLIDADSTDTCPCRY